MKHGEPKNDGELSRVEAESTKVVADFLHQGDNGDSDSQSKALASHLKVGSPLMTARAAGGVSIGAENLS